jgi:broad-specificity NMP kinase
MAKKSILITGTPGVGKTSLSNKLNELGYKSYDIDDIPGLFSMIHRDTKLPIKDHDNFNLEKVKVMTWICDIPKLELIIKNEQNDLAFYCGNGSNVYQFMELFDSVILLTINLETNKHRLSIRTDNDFARTEEVQEYVLSKKNSWENEMVKKGAIVVDAHNDLDSIAREVIKISENI